MTTNYGEKCVCFLPSFLPSKNLFAKQKTAKNRADTREHKGSAGYNKLNSGCFLYRFCLLLKPPI